MGNFARFLNSRLQHDLQQAIAGLCRLMEPIGTFSQGCDDAEQGFDLDAAILDAANRLGILACAGATAFERELTRDDFLQREGRVRLEVAHQHDLSGLPHTANREVQGCACAHDFANRLVAEQGEDDGVLIERAFQLALSRPPKEVEWSASFEFLKAQTASRQEGQVALSKPKINRSFIWIIWRQSS